MHREVVCSFIEVSGPVGAYSHLSRISSELERALRDFSAESLYLFEKETKVSGHSDKIIELSLLFLASPTEMVLASIWMA